MFITINTKAIKSQEIIILLRLVAVIILTPIGIMCSLIVQRIIVVVITAANHQNLVAHRVYLVNIMRGGIKSFYSEIADLTMFLPASFAVYNAASAACNISLIVLPCCGTSAIPIDTVI